jgi:hypothetical protein
MKNIIIPVIVSTLATLGSVHGQNIIQNGDFSAGNTSAFGSDYAYVPYNYANYTATPVIQPGHYSVGPVVPPSFSDWAPLTTVSGGDSQMLIANGAANALSRIWFQTLNVAPNTTYDISFYVAEISTPTSLANVGLTVNGNNIGNALAPSTQDEWQQFSFYWNSGSSSTATLSLADQNNGGAGNDFAIDNISMSQVPEPSDFALLGLGLPLVAWFGRGKFQRSNRQS